MSCRKYTKTPVSDEQLKNIYAAVRNTPTSYNGQNYCVIDVEDQEMKDRLFEIVGEAQIRDCSHFFVFCIDFNKIFVGAEAMNLPMPDVCDTADGLTVGIVDASLAMMSAIVSAESMGLGTCPIGYARTADPAAISKALNLPQHVFVVCGLSIGVPDEHNDIKPKQPVDLLFHNNVYSNDNIAKEIVDYDAVIRSYNEHRNGRKSKYAWIGHMIGFYKEIMTYRLLDAFKAQGFDIKE